ncbi:MULTISPECIES: YveK family protein [Cytobacillus]|uniref:YveK family protein n=1 Tax=Cytobacillus TaxID=2675230 RepID=UPI00203C70D6|nr:Wzz/FepE/Etk N-terminal domain-containing protein [Cytobacillus firmus]MCM3707863.1 Wzz/FepE/Etk N-terminal domain-containing protein [Cytobacillus firmus]
MNEQIDLKTFFRIIKKRWLTIIFTVISIFLLTSGLSIYVIKPTYEATENILIGKLTKKDGQYGDSQELNMLLASTIDLIKSPVVLNSVKEQFNLGDDDLDKKLAVQNNRDSQIVNVVVRGHDRDKTKEIANTIAKTTVNKMNAQFDVQDIKLLSDNDTDPSIKVVGSLSLNIAIGLVIGLFLGVGLAMWREYWDESIKNINEVEMALGLPVLGQVNLKKTKRMYKDKSGNMYQASLENNEGRQKGV